MGAVHIRNLEEQTIEALKARAERNRRSLQGELKLILEQAAQEAPAPKVRRKLALVTVSVGSKKTSFSRKDIYDDADER